MNDHRITDLGKQLQGAHRQMLHAHQHTHWVTLNFHSMPTRPDRVLHRWSFDVIDRIFRHRQFAGQPMEELFHFFAYPEYTRVGHLHYHLPTFVQPDRHGWFHDVAGVMWKRSVRTGTSDIQLITRTPEKVDRYATKYANRPISYGGGFIASNMLDLPTHGGPRTARLNSTRTGKLAA